MKKRSIVLAGVVVVASLGLAMIATPAFALPNPALTSLAMSPTTARSGDSVIVTANGSTSGDFSFNGCEFTDLNGAFLSAVPRGDNDYARGGAQVLTPNLYAESLTFRVYGYAGNNCSDPVSGSPTFDTGAFTITPQLEIEPIELTVGATPAVSSPYSDASATGESPFNWSAGGSIYATFDENCGVNIAPYNGESLPEGVTVDGSLSDNGQAPTLSLKGTPAAGSAGTYKTCFTLFDGTTRAYAWATITVKEPTLPATGLDASALGLIGLGALSATVIGAGFVIRRRAI